MVSKAKRSEASDERGREETNSTLALTKRIRFGLAAHLQPRLRAFQSSSGRTCIHLTGHSVTLVPFYFTCLGLENVRRRGRSRAR